MKSYMKRERNDLGIRMSRERMARKRRSRIRVVLQMKRTVCTQAEGRGSMYYHLEGDEQARHICLGNNERNARYEIVIAIFK